MIWLTKIFNLLGGGLAREFRLAMEKKADAKTEQDRIEASAYAAEIEAQTARALAGGRIITGMQAIWAGVFLIYDAKLVLWDKVLGWGVTDPLSPELLAHQGLIMGFLFGPAAIRRAIGR